MMRRIALVATLCLPSLAHAQLFNPGGSGGSVVDQAARDAAASAQTKADAAATASALSAMAATIPTPGSSAPPGVADAGTVGTLTNSYALANHTHASKARKGRVTTLANGTLTVALSPAFSSIPICVVVAEATSGETNIVNAQLDGPPTTSQLQVRVNRSAAQLVGLLGLTINVVQPSVATIVDYICIEP